MIINLFLLVHIIPSWYYYFVDYKYWLDNYTLHEWEGYPNINKIFIFKEALFSLLIIYGTIIGNFLLIKKNKKGIVFLGMPFIILLIRFLLGELNS